MKTAPGRDRSRLAGLLFMALASVLIASTPWAVAQPSENNQKSSGAQTVLITGANRGIGLELARQYSADGWRVIGTARKPGSAQELASVGAEVVQLDVTDQASVDRLAKQLEGRAIDVLINNAGIQLLMWKLNEVDFDAFEKSLSVNTVGPVRVTQALIPHLRASDAPRIINITTNLSSIADNSDGGFYGYRESKAALNMFTRSLAAEFGPEGFICIVLHPGWVRTDLGGPNAPLNVQESARGIRGVIDGLSAEDNGSFWTHDGKNMAW